VVVAQAGIVAMVVQAAMQAATALLGWGVAMVVQAVQAVAVLQGKVFRGFLPEGREEESFCLGKEHQVRQLISGTVGRTVLTEATQTPVHTVQEGAVMVRRYIPVITLAETTVVQEDFALSGGLDAHSHQQTRVICNETIYTSTGW
jgi:hypothetical protein